MSNRTYKFRGKRKDGKGWAFGYLVIAEGKTFILLDNAELVQTQFGDDAIDSPVEVLPETVGEYTGIIDTNDQEVYEGDDVDVSMSFEGGTLAHRGIITFDETFGAFATKNDAGLTLLHNHCLHTLKIIGNIHENPELLEAK